MTEALFRLRESVRLLTRKLGLLEKSEATCCGVTLSQCHTMVEIGRAGSISVNDLAWRWRYVKKNQDLHGLRRGVGTSLGRDIEKATAGYKEYFNGKI